MSRPWTWLANHNFNLLHRDCNDQVRAVITALWKHFAFAFIWIDCCYWLCNFKSEIIWAFNDIPSFWSWWWQHQAAAPSLGLPPGWPHLSRPSHHDRADQALPGWRHHCHLFRMVVGSVSRSTATAGPTVQQATGRQKAVLGSLPWSQRNCFSGGATWLNPPAAFTYKHSSLAFRDTFEDFFLSFILLSLSLSFNSSDCFSHLFAFGFPQFHFAMPVCHFVVLTL